MKTSSFYGFISALAGALLTLVLYFAGYHTDPAKFGTAQAIGYLGIVIFVVCLVLGIKARRAEVPAGQSFGYGCALGVGTQIALVAAALSAVFNFFYFKYINPGFADIIVQSKLDQLQAKGISGADLDRAESMTRTMLHPLPASIFNFIGFFVIGFLLALIAAAFLKRSTPPPALPAS